MPDSLELITPITDEEIEDIESVAGIVQQALETGDTGVLFDMISRDKSIIRTKGVRLMHWLYQMKSHWLEFGFEADNFEQVMFTQTGLSPQTVRKYSRIWEDIFENANIPIERKRKLYSFKIMPLYYLLAPVKDGVLDEEHWERIENAPDVSTIREITQELMGKNTSSSTRLTIMVDRASGDLLVARGGEMRFFGYLDIHSEQPDIIDAVTRLLGNSKVLDLGG